MDHEAPGICSKISIFIYVLVVILQTLYKQVCLFLACYTYCDHLGLNIAFIYCVFSQPLISL